MKKSVGLAFALVTFVTSYTFASAQSAVLKVGTTVKHVASASELMQMAATMADLKRFDEAITAYSLALEQEPLNGNILAGRALAYAWINHVDEASSDLKRAEQLMPEAAILHRVRAIIANRLSDEETELAELSKSLVLEPGNAFALTFRASIYQKKHLYPAALADMDALIRARPDEPEAYRMKAELLGAQRAWPEALRQAKLLEQRFPGQARALAAAAQIYSDAGDRKRALATIDRAIKSDPSFYFFWDMRSRVRRWDDYTGRRFDLETALRLSPGDLGLIASLGLLESRMDRWADANARFTQVLEKEPKDFGLLAYRAISWIKLGDQESAKRDYDSALSSVSGPGDLSMICRHFAREGAALDWALSSCDGAVAAQPLNASYLVNRGLVRLRSGDLAGARGDFDQAIENDADNGEAYYGRAIVNYRLGTKAKASKDRETALAIDPTVEEDFCAHGMCEGVSKPIAHKQGELP